MLTTFRQRERREGIVLKTISFPVPTIRHGRPLPTLRARRHAQNQAHPGVPHHQPHRPDFPDPAHLRYGPCARHSRDLSTAPTPSTISPSRFPTSIAIITASACTSGPTRPSAPASCYVRKSRIASTWSLMASGDKQAGDIRKFEEIGTHPAANHNAISEALVFNENIGIDRKAARLRYLRDRWAHRLAENPKCNILHSSDPAQSCGIGFLAFRGIDPGKIQSRVVEQVRHPHLPDGAPGVHRPAHHAQRLHFAARDRHLLRQGGAGTARVAGNTRPLTGKGPRHPRQESRG